MSVQGSDRGEASFSPRDLRDTLGLFPTGVAIITATTASGERLGATVSSFNSVSLDPPLVLFSLARAAKSSGAWEAVSSFAVNVLGENQSELSTRFAKALSDKWDGMAPVQAETINAPLIRDAIATFECESWKNYDGGDHIIFVGLVKRIARTANALPRPLVFSGGRYRQLDLQQNIETPYDTTQLIHGW
ncbi:flavin reductase family protein [Bosea sp. NPDC003192]|uniref:flavin reductase family protein n=1 Tax=Bosea sp. NPDC003192 TaxID=3390551 RepID=UPI003D03AFF0